MGLVYRINNIVRYMDFFAGKSKKYRNLSTSATVVVMKKLCVNVCV